MNFDKGRVVYIMTITVLKPYRRYGIGKQLLDKAI
jgi:ribosomal protein S18 acetylase RimI-like enzyme